MARFETPTHTDDEFDLIYDIESASSLTDHDVPGHDLQDQVHQVAETSSRSSFGAERPSGPHEILVMPHVEAYDDSAPLSRQFTGHTIQDASPSPAAIQRGPGSIRGRVNDGLHYTRSVCNRLWGKDALIAVMGMTGSGKTTFISKVTGRNDLQIGHDLTSCTREIQAFETKIDGQTVRLVDTPGFSDTHLSDTEVLGMIADYLAAAYRQEMKLSGIIYVHPISDNRVTHHITKNLEMFRKLTGEKNLKNVILVTSMWDKVNEAEGIRREEELKSKFWKLLILLGAKTVRHNDTPESANNIASMLLHNKPFYLQLQEEMGKDNKALRDTAAGREVMLELERMKEEHQRELAEMEDLIKSSARESEEVIEAMREHYQGKLSELERTLRDEKRMNEEAVRSLNDRIQALERKGIGCNVM